MGDLERDPNERDDWCARCGAPLPLDQFWGYRKYCSPACRKADGDELARQQRQDAKVGRTCRSCDKPLPLTKRAGAVKCDDCIDRKPKTQRATCRCLYCGASLLDRPSDVKFCGNACRQAYYYWQKKKARVAGRTCRECGGNIPVERQADAIFCSKRCQRQDQARRRRRRR